MFKKLFGEHGAKDVITVFTKPNHQASTRVLTFLKQHHANAATTATEDQASSHEHHNKAEHKDFTLDVQETVPTGDQLKSILEYIGSRDAGKVVIGARDLGDAIEKVKKDADAFRRPVVVDWHQGKVAIGEDESEILKLLKSVSDP